MKSKLLLALTSAIIGLATLGGNVAYADQSTTGMPGQAHCEDWSYNDANCPGYIKEREGKAAFGEPRGQRMEPAVTRSLFCGQDGGANVLDRNCVSEPPK